MITSSKNKSKEEMSNTEETSYEFNSFNNASDIYLQSLLLNTISADDIYRYFSKEDVAMVLANPIECHETAIRLSNYVYTKNGIVSNSIDYMTSLPYLDKIIVPRIKPTTNKAKKSVKKNKQTMKDVLKDINYKEFIRNALFSEMTDGIAFFYFDVKERGFHYTKGTFMADYDVDRITEINSSDVQASIISLPWRYTKIIGKINNRYVLAFDLKYFNSFEGDKLENKLKRYPQEIVQAYRTNPNSWIMLNPKNTMCKKIKCKDSEPWGRSLVISALSDVLYKDYFVDTKRNVLDEINNKVIYETFPEGKNKGVSALSERQQRDQHNALKTAIMNKNRRGAINVVSLAAGTKLDSISVSTDIFDDKNESDLNNQISVDLGICASLIGAMSSGNFAAGQNNLEMISSQLYSWVEGWVSELNYVINQNIINDEKNPVDLYIFPTTFVNRKSFFDMMKTLYSEAGGSLSFLIASTGVDVDTYLSVLDEEIDNGIFEKYKPHMTSYTLSSKDSTITDKSAGRPESEETPTNENTVQSKSNNSNSMPSPSDTK